MAVQIRTLESELAKERLDKEHLMEMLKNPKDHAYDDRETLKKAARALKQRALKAEETIQELTAVLADKERHLEQMIVSVDIYPWIRDSSDIMTILCTAIRAQ